MLSWNRDTRKYLILMKDCGKATHSTSTKNQKENQRAKRRKGSRKLTLEDQNPEARENRGCQAKDQAARKRKQRKRS